MKNMNTKNMLLLRRPWLISLQRLLILGLLMISRRAILGRVFLDPTAVIYGASVIGDESYIGGFTVIGFPTRDTLKSILARRILVEGGEAEYYSVGEGARIGDGCVVRSHVVIYEKALLGRRVMVGHGVLIRENTFIGDDTLIGSGSIIDGGVTVGNNVNIQSSVYIPPGVIIKDRVFIGPRAVFTNDRYPPSRRLVETIVEEEAVIGANSTIIAGVKIGRGAVIAAGSIVTRDVPERVVVAGNPARVIMSRDEYEAKKARYEAEWPSHPL